MTTSGVSVSYVGVSFFIMSSILLTITQCPSSDAITWSSEFVVNTDAGTEHDFFPAIVAVNGSVHIAWQDFGEGDWDIHYRLFDGTAWQPEEKISVDEVDEQQQMVALAVDGDDIHAVWMDGSDPDYDIVYRHFDGSTWQPEFEISNDTGNERQWLPAVAVDGESVHVVWEEYGDGDSDIAYRCFNGTAWETEREISADEGTETQGAPTIAAEGGRVHVAWTDSGDGDSDIHYRRFNGTAWESEQEISSDIVVEDQSSPHIVVEDDVVHVVWLDSGDGDSDVFYRRHDGTDWGPEIEVSMDQGTEHQLGPHLAIEGHHANVVWYDMKSIMDDFEIYYRHFDGTMWLPVQELSNDTGTEMQLDPAVAADDNGVHVVWADMEDGDMDIYYRHGSEDFGRPSSHVEPMPEYWQKPLMYFDWTATDNADLANISLYYRFSSDNVSWSVWSVFSRNDTLSSMSASGTFPFLAIPGDGYYEFHTIADDANGNQELPPAVPDAIAGVDTKPPYTTLSIGDPKFGTLPVYVSPPTEFTLIGADNLSGVESTWFGIDSEPMAAYTGPFNLSGYDGPHLLKFMSIDNAGNNETATEILVHIDETPPTSAIQFGQPAVVCWPRPMCISSSTEINISATDNGSGVESIWYRVDGNWTLYEGNFTIPTDGMHNIVYNSTDNVMNDEQTHYWGAFVDNTPPVADAGPDQEVQVGAMVTFDGDQSFDLGGLINHTWSFFDDGDVTLYWWNVTHKFETSGSFFVTLVVKDIMGYTDTDTMWVNVTAPPPAPTNLTVESGGRGELRLTWDAVENATGYNLYRANFSGGPHMKLNVTNTSRVFNDTGLPDETTFYYIVTAVNLQDQESSPSEEAFGTTIAIDDGAPSEYWWALALLVPLIILLVIFLARRRREKETPHDEP